MSITRNSENQPSVTCGFFNSSYGDRKYNAEQMSSLFDGIIRDGVFGTIGEHLIVSAGEGNTVIVGTGKCWFNHTWTKNDAPLMVECSSADTVADRYDAIVVEVNTTEAVRANSIKFIEGPQVKDMNWDNPTRPTLSKDNGVYQYPLCYIKRVKKSASITGSDIVNTVGKDEETPFITGVLEVVSLKDVTRQWEAELDEFIAEKEAETAAFISNQQSEYSKWFDEMTALAEEAMEEIGDWTTDQKATILDWFEDLKTTLSDDVAANLKSQIDKNEIKRILLTGLIDGTKTYSEDGLTITSVDSSGKRLVKTYSDDFSTCTTVLYSSAGGELGRLVKTFTSDGTESSAEVNVI